MRRSTDQSRRNVGEGDAEQAESAEVAFGGVDLGVSEKLDWIVTIASWVSGLRDCKFVIIYVIVYCFEKVYNFRRKKVKLKDSVDTKSK